MCTSGNPKDLDETDRIAAEVIKSLAGFFTFKNCINAISDQPGMEGEYKQQYEDNLHWIVRAKENKLVVGSQARILYSDAVVIVLITIS